MALEKLALQILVGLAADAVQAFAEVLFHVVYGSNDGEQGRNGDYRIRFLKMVIHLKS